MEAHIQFFVEKSWAESKTEESTTLFEDLVQAWQQSENSSAFEERWAAILREGTDEDSAARRFVRGLQVAGEDLIADSFVLEAVDLESDIQRVSFVAGTRAEEFLRGFLGLLATDDFVRGRLTADETEILAGVRDGEVVAEWCGESVDEAYASWWHGGRPALESLIAESPRVEDGSTTALEDDPDDEDPDDEDPIDLRDLSDVDWIGESAALSCENLLGEWIPNAEKTTAAFRADAENHWARMPGLMREMSGSLDEYIEGAIAKIEALIGSSKLRFTKEEMIRTFGSKTYHRPYVIDAIDDGLVRFRSRTNSRWEVEVEDFTASFPEENCLELRKGKGKKVSVEVYDRHQPAP